MKGGHHKEILSSLPDPLGSYIYENHFLWGGSDFSIFKVSALKMLLESGGRQVGTGAMGIVNQTAPMALETTAQENPRRGFSRHLCNYRQVFVN